MYVFQIHAQGEDTSLHVWYKAGSTRSCNGLLLDEARDVWREIKDNFLKPWLGAPWVFYIEKKQRKDYKSK